MKNNKFLIISVLAVGIFICATAGITYSFFRIPINGEQTSSIIESGKIKITSNIESVPGINAMLYLIEENEKNVKAENISFEVTSAADSVDGRFDVYLKDIVISKNLINQYFKYEVLANGVVVSSGDFKNIEINGIASTTANTATTNYYSRYNIAKGIEITSNETKNVVIRVYLQNDSNVDQNGLMNGSFSCKAGLEMYN